MFLLENLLPPIAFVVFFFVVVFSICFICPMANKCNKSMAEKKKRNAGWDETKKPCIYNTTENKLCKHLN